MKSEAKKRLPRDLKWFSFWRAALRILIWGILMGAFGAVIYLWGPIIFPSGPYEFRISCYVAFMLIPFPLTGMPWKLIDSTFGGEVKFVDVETTMEPEHPGAPTLRMFYRNTTTLLIVDGEGRELFKKVSSQRLKKRYPYTDKYKKYDRVLHLYGSKYTVVLPKPSDTRVQCAACGVSNDIKDDRCHRCRHTLVKRMPE